MIARILRNPITRLVLVAVVPALVLGVFVGALAAADNGDARIPAALVNQDRLVQQKNDDGSTTPIAAGRLVVTGLTKPADADSGATIDWTLTNASSARQMLADGEVYAIVTIPRDFSKSIATVSGTDPQQAGIRIRTDDAHGTIVSQVGGIVGDTIASTVGGQITTNVVSGLYGGYASVRTSLLKAADGANDLGDGAGSLSTGLVKTADGTDGIATGVRSLGGGARRLATGARSLSGGLDQAATGARSAADGAKRFAGGVDTYTDGVAQYTGGIDRLVGGITPAVSAASAALQDTKELTAGASALADRLRAAAADPDLPPKTRTALTALAGKLDAVASSGSGLRGGASQLAAASRALGQLKSAGSQLRSGGSRLDSGAASLARGLDRLPSGIGSAADGAGRLADGATDLGSGADRLATGTTALADGVRKSAKGASGLADGARKLGTGLEDGAGQVPNLTKAQREQAGKVIANPVTASATRANELSGPGQVVSTLIVPVGLWIGAAALVLLFGAVSRRLLVTGVGTGRLVLGALLRGGVIAVVQAVLVVVLLAATLGLDWPAAPLLFLVALIAGVAFLALHQLLQTAFGRAGTVLSVVLLGVQLVAVGGIYPIELVSAPFQAISPLLPLTAAVRATTAVLTGTAGAGGGLLTLVLWALVSVLLTVAVVGRRRSSVDLFGPVPAPA